MQKWDTHNCGSLPDCGNTAYRALCFVALFHLGEFVHCERHQHRRPNVPSEPALPYLSLAEVAAPAPAGRSSCRSLQPRAGIRIAYDRNTGYRFAGVSGSRYLPGGSSGFYLRFSQKTFAIFPMGGILKTRSPSFRKWLVFLLPTGRILVLFKDVPLSIQNQLLRCKLLDFMQSIISIGGPPRGTAFPQIALILLSKKNLLFKT